QTAVPQRTLELDPRNALAHSQSDAPAWRRACTGSSRCSACCYFVDDYYNYLLLFKSKPVGNWDKLPRVFDSPSCRSHDRYLNKVEVWLQELNIRKLHRGAARVYSERTIQNEHVSRCEQLSSPVSIKLLSFRGAIAS